MLAAAAIAYALCYLLLERSRFGFQVKAVRDNEIAARAQGINATLVKIGAFVLSAMIPAVLGGINAYWITFINPDSVLNTIITDQIVVMVLVGGLGHAWGPALGATALFLLQEQLRVSYGETTAYIIIVGALVMAVVLFLPDGLVSIGRRARRMRLIRQYIRGTRKERKEDRADANGPRGRGDHTMTVLAVDDLFRSFGGIRAVDGVSFAVEQAEIVGIIGPNGSGKSTLFNLLTGALKPDKGTITLFDKNITRLAPHKIARAGLSRTFQIPALFVNMTVRENLWTAAVQFDWNNATASRECRTGAAGADARRRRPREHLVRRPAAAAGDGPGADAEPEDRVAGRGRRRCPSATAADHARGHPQPARRRHDVPRHRTRHGTRAGHLRPHHRDGRRKDRGAGQL